jgi:hypothetical protein
MTIIRAFTFTQHLHFKKNYGLHLVPTLLITVLKFHKFQYAFVVKYQHKF